MVRPGGLVVLPSGRIRFDFGALRLRYARDAERLRLSGNLPSAKLAVQGQRDVKADAVRQALGLELINHIQSRFLLGLSTETLTLLMPRLERVELEGRTIIQAEGQPATWVFPETAVVSFLVTGIEGVVRNIHGWRRRRRRSS